MDFFSGDGRWETWRLGGFGDLHCWELDAANEAGLRHRLPLAHVRIGDSYAFAGEYPNRFDVVVSDNHVGAFGNHVEHFDALPLLAGLLRDEGYLILNTCSDPIGLLAYNYIRNYRALGENTRTYIRKIQDGTYKRWLHGRLVFYGGWVMDHRDLERHYRAYFEALGLGVAEVKFAERRPFLDFMRVKLVRK